MIFDDNSIVISNNKNYLLTLNNKLLGVKIMSLNEFIHNYFFSYDEKTIYYLINKYGYDYDVCLKYLNSMYYVSDDDFDSDKIRILIDLKKELFSNNLLYENELFKEYLKDKSIVFYNCYIDKFINMFINKLGNVKVLNDESLVYDHVINEFDNIEDEVLFISSSIIELINSSVDINKIKLCGVTDEYKNIIRRIFKFYNIPIIFNDNYLYSTSIGKDFLDNLSIDFSNSLEYISNKYDMNDSHVLDIYNAIVKIVNKYIWASDIDIVKKMIIHDFKNTLVNEVKLDKAIEVINEISNYDDNYIFLLNFSQGYIPEIYKDEDFLSDKLKFSLGLDTSYDMNNNSYLKWTSDIKGCKNLVISYKKHSFNGDFYLSSLNDSLKYEIVNPKIEYNYSDVFNKLKLSSDIDNLVKYNINSEELELLYNHYLDIGYMSYDNKYSSIDKDKYVNYLDHKLSLSYSAINNYYQCSFKYYLSNILKISIYDDSFYTIIGKVFHYILSICFDKDIDVKKEYYDYVSKLEYEFNDRDKFFLDNLFSELIFIINSIKKQYSYCSFNHSLYEEEIEVDKSTRDMMIIFKGYVDKIMLDDSNNYASIIDYKTGNPDLDLNNCIYGLDLQLPVYVYLLKNKFPNIRVVGFYLQKILSGKINIDSGKDYDTLMEDKLKLQGYSNKDENILKLFDSNYFDSKIIKGMKVSSKGLSSKKVFDDEGMDKLYNLTDKKIDESINNILDANFSINPKKIDSDNKGCMFCKYKDICFVREEDIIYLDENVDGIF